jgi:hypothetical protein
MKFSEKAKKFFRETSAKVKKFVKEVAADRRKLTIAVAVILIAAVGLPLTLGLTLGGKPKKLSVPARVAVDAETKTVTWDEVKNASGYTVLVGRLSPLNADLSSTAYAEVKENEANGRTYSLAELTVEGTYEIKVMAKGDGKKFSDSDWSSAKEYTVSENGGGDPTDPNDPDDPTDPNEPGGNDDAIQLTAPQVTIDSNKILTWGAVPNAIGYTVSIDGAEHTEAANETSYDLSGLTEIKTYPIKVKAIGNGPTYLNSEWSNTVNYTVTASETGTTGLYYESIKEGNEIIAYSVRLGSASESNTGGNIVVLSTHEGKPITQIGGTGFSGQTWIKSFSIPDTVTYIGYKAFEGCTGLTSIKLPDAVTSIVDYAFRNTGLTSITIPDNVTYISQYAFADCKDLETVTFGNNRKLDTASNIFNNCSSLTSVTFGENIQLTEIAMSVFEGCVNLTEIEIPDSVISLGVNAFKGCEKLTNVSFGENSGLEKINGSTFLNCVGLTTIQIPDGVTFIGLSTFYGCSNLESVNIPDGVTEIGNHAFFGCESLTEITLPEGLEKIEDRTFEGCLGLASIIIPESVTFVGRDAFLDTGIWYDAPDGGVIYADKWAIGYKELSGELTLKEDTVGIGGQAFFKFPGLTEIVIPESVKYISDCAFEKCSGLTTVMFRRSLSSGEITSIYYSAFTDCSSIEHIYVPADSVEAYKSVLYNYYEQVTAIPE